MTYAKTIQQMTAHGSHLFAANDDQQEEETCAGDLSEADLERIDREFGIARNSGALERRSIARAQTEELKHTPNGGYLHG